MAVSRARLVRWASDCLECEFGAFSEIAKPSVYLRLLYLIFPNHVRLGRISNDESSSMRRKNLKHMQEVFNALDFKKPIDVPALDACNVSAALDMLRYIRELFIEHNRALRAAELECEERGYDEQAYDEQQYNDPSAMNDPRLQDRTVSHDAVESSNPSPIRVDAQQGAPSGPGQAFGRPPIAQAELDGNVSVGGSAGHPGDTSTVDASAAPVFHDFRTSQPPAMPARGFGGAGGAESVNPGQLRSQLEHAHREIERLQQAAAASNNAMRTTTQQLQEQQRALAAAQQEVATLAAQLGKIAPPGAMPSARSASAPRGASQPQHSGANSSVGADRLSTSRPAGANTSSSQVNTSLEWSGMPSTGRASSKLWNGPSGFHHTPGFTSAAGWGHSAAHHGVNSSGMLGAVPASSAWGGHRAASGWDHPGGMMGMHSHMSSPFGMHMGGMGMPRMM